MLPEKKTSSGISNNAISGSNWVQFILEASLPNFEGNEEEEQRIKKDIIQMLKPMMDVANRSNLKRWEIPEFLRGYDIVWQKFFVYKRGGKYDPDLLVLKSSLREEYALELCRSIDMGMMSMIFQPQKIEHVFQRFADETRRKLGFFKTKKNNDGFQGGQMQ